MARTVITNLKQRGAKRIVAVTREPARIADIEGVEARAGDFSRPETLDSAFRGIDRLLIVSATDLGVRIGRHVAAIDAGRLATVRGYALDDDDRLRAELIERLMCDLAVDVPAVCRRHGTGESAVADAYPALNRLAADGILRLDGGIVAMAEDARDLVRLAAAAFDAYRAGSGAVHSRAV